MRRKPYLEALTEKTKAALLAEFSGALIKSELVVKRGKGFGSGRAVADLVAFWRDQIIIVEIKSSKEVVTIEALKAQIERYENAATQAWLVIGCANPILKRHDFEKEIRGNCVARLAIEQLDGSLKIDAYVAQWHRCVTFARRVALIPSAKIDPDIFFETCEFEGFQVASPRMIASVNQVMAQKTNTSKLRTQQNELS